MLVGFGAFAGEPGDTGGWLQGGRVLAENWWVYSSGDTDFSDSVLYVFLVTMKRLFPSF